MKDVQHTFQTGQVARINWVDSSTDLPTALSSGGIVTPSPVLVVVGGAGQMSAEDHLRLYELFAGVLAPLAQAVSAVIIDGGTNAGVMHLNGKARMETGSDYRLIGIAAAGTVAVPAQPAPRDGAAQLEPHHTDFFLVPGTEWGDEAPWIARIASAIAGNTPSVTLLINGGNIAWQDAAESVQQGRTVVVLAGSGRTADTLAQAVRGEISDGRADALIASGLIQVVDISNLARLKQVMWELLAP